MQFINRIYGTNLTFDSIPLDDKKTWDLISSGNTLGVFQFASQLAISVVTKIKPTNIEELSAANAFIRPGASGLDEYLIAKKDSSKRRRLHSNLDSLLETTYGAIVYQEQVMGLIGEIMGIDFGEADEYRRLLEDFAKKPAAYADKVNAWKEKFGELGVKNGYDKKLVDLLIELIIENSGYGFNKSHAVSYSIISYWTAYMKANYPLVFYMTMLNGNLDDADSFIAEATRLNIKILPPHVNFSKLGFTIEGDNIRAGFNSIKGVGPKAVDSIVLNQPFESVDDYFGRNDKAAINKAVVAALIGVGAFDDLGIHIDDNDIPSELNDKFEFTYINNDKYVVLNREQMSRWYEFLNEINTKKPVPNYLVPVNMIAGKFFDTFELVEEKEDAVIVVPEDRLKDLNLTLMKLPNQEKTRKKPKGSFDKSNDVMKNIPPFRKPIILHHRELSNITITYLDMYLKESSELGFSFLPHPLEKHLDKINLYEDVEDGQPMVTAGIVTEIIQRQTKKGKPFYWVMLKSPRDIVRITLWDNQLAQYKNSFFKNSLLVVKGQKGFGGMSMEVVKDLNASFKGE